MLGLLLLFYGCSQKLLKTQDSTRLKVMSYNIHHANPPSKPELIDMEAIALVISKAQPDLVALQEVDVNTKRSGNIDQANWLADRLKMEVFFAKAIDHDGGKYGVAILSRFPIDKKKIIRLPSQPETKGEPRILATVMVNLPNGKKFRFGCTHLDAQKAETNRLMQAQVLVSEGKTMQMPFIMAGDWNARPNSKTVETIDQAFTRTCSDCEYTIPVINPKSTIDFISFGKNHPLKVISHQVIPERYASDHLPILSVIQLDQP